ncbi:unnamed protein product [Candidula unifasciata]|uniref:NADH:ubiquinone oxidoreductase intermediate-associated protein 30 domain-containing protein n=1 Tax=Candidula unifasciata TaxID=100452 RepID=A0A8S3ZCP1_9EUPU|nr:unnamed protein product [Candidula unifasciata]
MASGNLCRKLPLSAGRSLTFLKPKHKILHEQRATAFSLWENNKKGTDEIISKPPLVHRINQFVKTFVPETKKYIEEKKLGLSTGVMLEAEHGNYQVVFRFDTQEIVSSWIVSTDKDNNQGQSTADFVLTQNRTGLFRGNLCTEVPKDGKTKYAGFANITCPPPMKSYSRETHWDWSLFNCFLVKLRGDGRHYNIILGCDFEYDIMWLNRWSYPLFTHGGPYWQVAKIPFSKFYLSYRGRIQDKQEPVPMNIINSFGITLADKVDGPFCLEIDSVAVMYDINLSAKFAYELYHDRHYLTQT